jgi:tripeptide aminopeptidase
VIEHIQNHLGRIGIESSTDSTDISLGDSGNLIAKMGRGRSEIMFVAHVDTVEDGKRVIKPKIKDGMIRSNGTTILGSDDKAGVAALLSAMASLKGEKGTPSILCVFSVREENGIMGVNNLRVDKKINFVFDVDGSNPPGQFVNKALGSSKFELHIYGKEAHAAKEPEKGRNAIETAGVIVSKLNLGRDASGHALNIGTITGGSKDNVVPAHCVLTGLARAFTVKEMDDMLKRIGSVAGEACGASGCTYVLKKLEADPPLYTKETEEIVKIARAAATNAKIKFGLLTMPATLQGNTLSAKGYSVLGLSKGGQGAHSKDESISVRELEDTTRLIIEIVRAVRDGKQKREK